MWQVDTQLKMKYINPPIECKCIQWNRIPGRSALIWPRRDLNTRWASILSTRDVQQLSNIKSAWFWFRHFIFRVSYSEGNFLSPVALTPKLNLFWTASNITIQLQICGQPSPNYQNHCISPVSVLSKMNYFAWASFLREFISIRRIEHVEYHNYCFDFQVEMMGRNIQMIFGNTTRQTNPGKLQIVSRGGELIGRHLSFHMILIFDQIYFIWIILKCV